MVIFLAYPWDIPGRGVLILGVAGGFPLADHDARAAGALGLGPSDASVPMTRPGLGRPRRRQNSAATAVARTLTAGVGCHGPLQQYQL